MCCEARFVYGFARLERAVHIACAALCLALLPSFNLDMTHAPDRDPARYLATLTGHPPAGQDVLAWRARYAPLIAEVSTPRGATTASPAVSVILVAWRARDGLRECLEHLVAQRGVRRDAIEVILVNNGEPELETFDALIDAHVDRLVEMKLNVGASPARNIGAAHASAPLLCFLDDDGLIAPDYMARGLAHFARDPQLTALRTRIVAKDHPYFTTLAKHYDRGPNPVEDCLITEGSFMVRAASFFLAGGFDDALFGHEGIELTYELKRRDPQARVRYVPDMVMRHDYIHTWEKFFQKNARYATITSGDRAPVRSPELQRFMDAFFARRYPRGALSVDEKIALILLKILRYLIKTLA